MNFQTETQKVLDDFCPERPKLFIKKITLSIMVLAILSQVLSSYSKFACFNFVLKPPSSREAHHSHSKNLERQLWNLSQLKRYAPESLHLPSRIGLKIKKRSLFPTYSPRKWPIDAKKYPKKWWCFKCILVISGSFGFLIFRFSPGRQCIGEGIIPSCLGGRNHVSGRNIHWHGKMGYMFHFSLKKTWRIILVCPQSVSDTLDILKTTSPFSMAFFWLQIRNEIDIEIVRTM